MAVLVKTVNGLAYASLKTRMGLAAAAIKSMNGLDTSSSGPQSASDNFNSYADASLLGGQGSWVDELSTMLITNVAGNGRFSANVNTTQTLTRYAAGTWAADQYAEITCAGSAVSGSSVGAAVRLTGSGDGYAISVTYSLLASTVYLVKFNGGSVSVITTPNIGPILDGDVIRLEVTGTGSATRLVLYNNAVEVIPSIDPGATYINAGNPGIYGYTSNNTDLLWGGTLWAASDL